MWLPGRLKLKDFQSLDCKVLSVMPYLSNGKKYLTPINAADNLLTKIGAGEMVLCLMITATTEVVFVEKLQSLVNTWALPDFQKALRISKTLVTFDDNKMIIPGIDNSISNTPLSTPQTRQILAAQKVGQIKPLSLSAMKSNVNAFTNKQSQLINAAKSAAQQSGTAEVDLFYYFGFASDLKKDIPNQNHVFTLQIAFVGSDIIKLIGLLT